MSLTDEVYASYDAVWLFFRFFKSLNGLSDFLSASLEFYFISVAVLLFPIDGSVSSFLNALLTSSKDYFQG